MKADALEAGAVEDDSEATLDLRITIPHALGQALKARARATGRTQTQEHIGLLVEALEPRNKHLAVRRSLVEISLAVGRVSRSPDVPGPIQLQAVSLWHMVLRIALAVEEIDNNEEFRGDALQAALVHILAHDDDKALDYMEAQRLTAEIDIADRGAAS